MTNLDGFLNFLNSLPDFLIYFFLGLSAFVENIFPPIPGDTITALGAFLVGTQRLHFLGVYFSTTIGSLFGFMFLFWIGSLLGKRFFVDRDYRFFKAEDIIRAEEWYRKYGYFLVLIKIKGFKGRLSGLHKLRCMESDLDGLWLYAGQQLGDGEGQDGLYYGPL